MKKVIGFAAMLAVGGIFGYAIAHFFLADEGPSTSSYPDYYAWIVLLLLPVMYFIVVGWHELGHVLAGKLENFTFHSFTVGPFAWKREGDGSIGFHWNRNLNVSGGVAIMLPEGDDNLAHRFARYAAGGPISSVVLGLLCWGLHELLPEGNFFKLMVLAIGLLSGMIFIATAIPFRSGGFASDGLRVLSLMRGGEDAVADLAVLQAMGVLRSGRSYDQLPIDQFAAMEQNESIPDTQKITGQYYQYLYHLSQDELDLAEEKLNAAIAKLDSFPKGMEGGFYLELALFHAKYRGDLAAAEAAMEKFEPNPTIEKMSLALTRAAIAELQGAPEQVQAELPAIEAGLGRTLNQSRVPEIREWLNAWRAGKKTTA